MQDTMKTQRLTEPTRGQTHPVLRSLRELEPRSLRAWAKDSGVHFTTIHHLMHGKRTLTLVHLVRLADALGFALVIRPVRSKSRRGDRPGSNPRTTGMA